MQEKIAKNTARSIINQVAPREISLFEDLWAEMLTYGKEPIDEADTVEHAHGFGGGEHQVFTISALIIPLVIDVFSDVLTYSFKEIVSYLRERTKNRKEDVQSDLDIEELARTVAKELQKIESTKHQDSE